MIAKPHEPPSTVNVVDSRTILGMDIGFFTGFIYEGPTKILTLGPCPVGPPIIVTVAHISLVASCSGRHWGFLLFLALEGGAALVV